MSRLLAVNWRRGFLRLWIALTAIWVALWMLIWSPLADYHEMVIAKQQYDRVDQAQKVAKEVFSGGAPYTYPNGDVLSEEEIEADLARLDELSFKYAIDAGRKQSHFSERLYLFLGAPILALLGGIGIVWIVRGFRPSTTPLTGRNDQ